MSTTQLPPIPDKGVLTIDRAMLGPAIAPSVRLQVMSPEEWQQFTVIWAHSLKSKYVAIHDRGGSGDQGLDVVAWKMQEGKGPWDNYQCKHYDHPLYPGDAWLELGKLCYYVHSGAYTTPDRYYFVAPQWVGTELSKLLGNGDALRKGLIENWDAKCRKKITATQDILLEGELREFVDRFDFSIVTALLPLDMIKQVREGPHYTTIFGEGLPERGEVTKPPTDIAAIESNYIRALLDAYEDRLKCAIGSVSELTDVKLLEHFRQCRVEFFSAESLREFSKDSVSVGTYDSLLNEMYDGVIDILNSDYPDAVERIRQTVARAKLFSSSSNALMLRVLTGDKGGRCHQLANDTRIKWRL